MGYWFQFVLILTAVSVSESKPSCLKPHQEKVFSGKNSWPITKLFEGVANSQTNISVGLRLKQSNSSMVYIGGARKDIGQQTWKSNVDPQRYPYAFTRDGYFVIQNTTRADNGTLLIFNVIGLSKYINHPVCIQLVYSTLEVKGSNIIATENETITMYCNGSGNPPPKFMWTKNGNDSVLHKGESYTLRNIQREQNGTKYVCTAENGMETAKGYVLVTVLYPPTIESRPDDNEIALEGSNVFLQIVATGNPAPSITWTKVGDPEVLNQGGIFYFPKIRMEKTGIYIYTVWNGVGEPLNGTVTLTVESCDKSTHTTGNAGGLSTGTAVGVGVGLGILIGLLVSLVIFLVYKGWIPRLCCHCHSLLLTNGSHRDQDLVSQEMKENTSRPHAKNSSPSGEEESNFVNESMHGSCAASAL